MGGGVNYQLGVLLFNNSGDLFWPYSTPKTLLSRSPIAKSTYTSILRTYAKKLDFWEKSLADLMWSQKLGDSKFSFVNP
jgi:hypothetical protein